MKKLCLLIMVTILITSLVGNVFAAPIENDLLSKNIITIGYISNSSHIVYNESSSIGGIGYDYFTEIEKYTNYLFEHVECTPLQAFELLQSGEIDLLGPVSITQQYIEDNFIYTKNAVTGTQIVLATPTNSNIAYNDFSMLENYTIAMDNYGMYNAYENVLKNFELENDVKLNTIRLNDVGSAAFEINTGEYDVKLMGLDNTNSQMEIVAELGFEPLHYIALNENATLINDIDNAMDSIISEDHAFSEKLYVEYYGQSEFAVSAYSVQQKDLLNSLDTINVYYSGNNEPFQYTNDQGEAAGITIEIMKLIEQDLDVSFNFIQDNISNEGELSGNELSICFFSTDKMVGSYNKTNAYLDLPLSMIGLPQEETQDYFFVGSWPYLDGNIENSLRAYGTYVIAYYNTSEEMVALLNKEVLNFIVVPTAISDYVLKHDDEVQHFEYQLNYSYPLQILVSNEAEPELLNILNTAIDRLTQEQTDFIIAQATLNLAPEDTFADLMLRNLEISIIVIMVVIFAFIFVAWYGNVRRQRDLLQLINTDSLTGALSKYAFFERAKKELSTSKPGENALYSLDVDNFKIINESYGYGKGSQVIAQLAKYIEKAFNNNAIVAREANDKFLILVNTGDMSDDVSINKKGKEDMLFRLALRQILADDYSLNVSVGKYEIEDTSLDLDYMIDCANYARLLAKNKYGNTMVTFTKEMHESRKVQNTIVSSMEQALFSDEFEVYYQPKICLKTEKIIGAEALVRWIRNGKPIFFPDQFIPIFESNRFIVRLDYYMTQHVCKFIKNNYELLKDFTISINLSGITIMEDKLIASLVKVVKDNLNSNNNIEFEVTESAFIENFEFVVSAIKELREKGFTISMDDFGSGLSSYNRLKDIPLDILKIDKEFCKYSLNDEKGEIIVQSIINLAKLINLKVVAEGVETRVQADTLNKLGCDIAQGYLFAKPMQGRDFIKMVEQQNEQEKR